MVLCVVPPWSDLSRLGGGVCGKGQVPSCVRAAVQECWLCPARQWVGFGKVRASAAESRSSPGYRHPARASHDTPLSMSCRGGEVSVARGWHARRGEARGGA